jgi:hypothetical protein
VYLELEEVKNDGEQHAPLEELNGRNSKRNGNHRPDVFTDWIGW